jgi:hypothetical protein
MCGALFAFLAAFTIGAPSLRAEPPPPPTIQVYWCELETGPNAAVLNVNYRIDGPGALSSITWRVKYGSGWLDFLDVANLTAGQLIPAGTLIRKKVTQVIGPVTLTQPYHGLPYPENCSVIATTSSTGGAWVDPTVTRDASVPTPLPDDATPLPPSIDNPLHDPVGVIGCAYGLAPGHASGFMPQKGRSYLFARFRNLAATPLNQVVFRVPYGSGGFDFIDGGTFSPGVLISSAMYVAGQETTKLFRIDIPVQAIYQYLSLDEASNCTVVSARYADGTQWQNPYVGPTEPPLPTPIPTPPA